MSMTIDDYLKQNPRIRVLDCNLRAAHHLEKKGFKFLIDFGYDNAQAVWREKKLWYYQPSKRKQGMTR